MIRKSVPIFGALSAVINPNVDIEKAPSSIEVESIIDVIDIPGVGVKPVPEEIPGNSSKSVIVAISGCDVDFIIEPLLNTVQAHVNNIAPANSLDRLEFVNGPGMFDGTTAHGESDLGLPKIPIIGSEVEVIANALPTISKGLCKLNNEINDNAASFIDDNNVVIWDYNAFRELNN